MFNQRPHQQTTRPIAILGVPTGLGGRCRGTAGGPRAIREAGLVRRLQSCGLRVEDLGDVRVADAVRWAGEDPGPELSAAVGAMCVAVRDQVRNALLGGRLPLVLGGEHSLSAGSQAGVASAYRALGHEPPGLIWFDAHADINTMDSTPSGNLHGMPVAALLGLPVPAFLPAIGSDGTRNPRRMVMVAQRDIDPGEYRHIDALGVRVYTCDDLRRRGIDAVMAEAILYAAGDDGRFSMSFDLDSLDPHITPGVDCHVEGGITLDEMRIALGMVADHGGLVQLDVVEMNPTKDIDTHTAHVAVEAAASMLEPVSAEMPIFVQRANAG
ncbi:MAG: arginase [Phycisphaerae bacterium]|nr:arginase [Phycisphaerae bacterium]